MNKKIILSLVIFLTPELFGEAPTLRVLRHRIIQEIDGSNLGMNGDAIGRLLYIRSLIKELLMGFENGKPSESKQYQFKGTSYSIHALARLETEDGNSPELKKVLTLALNDYIEVALQFVDDIKGTKETVVRPLMLEWSNLENRPDNCLLIRWAQEPENDHELELAWLKGNIHSFAELNEFCMDLLSFMTMFVKSCPKGYKQFQEQMAAA